MENEFKDLPVVEQKESIKLMKMSKGYNWEIKTLDMDLDRLEGLNNSMKARFQNEGN